MSLLAAQSLAQRAVLMGMAQPFHDMFMEGKYWGARFSLVDAGKSYAEEYEGYEAHWHTEISRMKKMQPCVKWTIDFQPVFESLTIVFRAGELRSITWQRKGFEDWHLDTRRKNDPPLVDAEPFYWLILMFSAASARYIQRYSLPCRGSAAHLLKVLK